MIGRQDDDNEQTDSDNDGDDFVHPKLSTHNEKDKEEEDSDPKVHTPSNYASTNDEEIQDAPCTIVQTTQVIEDTHVIITPVNPEAQQQSSSVSSGFVSNMLNPSPDTAVSSIPDIVDAYLANKMHEAIKTAVQLQSDRLRDEAQAKNADFIINLMITLRK
ncbi:hypothetical protein Tco_0386520 [Tanacetum coccineum]